MDKDIKFQIVLDVIINLIRNVQLKRVIESIGGKHLNLNFWRVISGNAMDTCIIEWNKLFGADRSQQAHWENIFTEEDNFKTEMLNYLEVSEDKFERYREKMRKIRDKYTAHFDLDHILSEKYKQDNYPYLDLAINSAYFYYKKVYSKLHIKTFIKKDIDGNGEMKSYKNTYPKDVENYFQKIYEDFESKYRLAIKSHEGLIEKIF